MADNELVKRMNEAFLAGGDLPARSEAAQLFGATTPVWVERRICLQDLCRRLQVGGEAALADDLSAVDPTALARALVFAAGELSNSDWTEE